MFQRIIQWRKKERSQRVQDLRAVLFWVLCVHITLFSFGHSFQEIGGGLSLVLLLALYVTDFRRSRLAQFRPAWILVFLYIYIGLNVALSAWPGTSWHYMKPNLWQGFVMPFAGLEAIRGLRDLRRLAIAAFIAVFAQGLDGVWQYVTGYDLVRHDPSLGQRLTGSMSTYRVGNYMGIMLVPASAIWLWLKKPQKPLFLRGILCLLFLSPAFFLWLFSYTRSGWLGYAGALVALWVFLLGRFSWKKCLLVAISVLCILFAGPQRASFEKITQDGRVELWSAGWELVTRAPVFGYGASTYRQARKAEGIQLKRHKQDIPHPHNMYLQFLIDGGIVGGVVMGGSLLGLCFLSWRRIRRGLWNSHVSKRLYWQYAAFFWAGYVSYLITGLTGHNFYRTWWLATGFLLLGICLGAWANGDIEEKKLGASPQTPA